MNNIRERDMELLEKFCLETISKEEHTELEGRLLESASLRKEARSYLSMDAYLNMDMDLMMGMDFEIDNNPTAPLPVKALPFLPMAVAASISFVAGLLVLYAIISKKQNNDNFSTIPDISTETKGSGFAVIDKTIDVEWTDTNYANGQSIGKEVLKLKKGIVHLEFFCGASVIIEGPAEFEIKNSWEAFCHSGKLRANVPPAAHGFRINTPRSKIVDLGTEFGLDVSADEESVVVFDGEVELHSKDKKMILLTAGKGVRTKGQEQKNIIASNAESFIKTADLNDIRKAEKFKKYSSWKKQSQLWANDPRLITYHNFDSENSSYVRSINTNAKSNLDGKIILAERVNGRWNNIENDGALEFKKPGSRARVNIPGEFSNFSFSAWVRIDSLNHDWNSLFMGDSYQVGEPHWQINKKGCLVICVKVYERKEQWHYLYMSDPIWDPSKRGQWLHLATVFSPEQKTVKHYLNGKVVYKRQIDEVWQVKKLRIGPAEIGNWGLPTRNAPDFALRNLNGRIDELMIFDAVLDDAEIQHIYKSGKAE